MHEGDPHIVNQAGFSACGASNNNNTGFIAGGSIYDNQSFDALFGVHYDSENDEDYSMKEDLI